MTTDEIMELLRYDNIAAVLLYTFKLLIDKGIITDDELKEIAKQASDFYKPPIYE